MRLFSPKRSYPEGETVFTKKICERLDNLESSLSIIESKLNAHDEDIKELNISMTKQDKILQSGPILPFTNDLDITRDLAKDFDCATTHTIFARSVSVS